MNEYIEKLRALKEKNIFLYASKGVSEVSKGPKESNLFAKECSSGISDTFDTHLLKNNKNILRNKAAEEETAIRQWLEHIEETDLAILQCVLDQCTRDADARTYFLEHATKANMEPKPEPFPDYSATCKTCKHFERIDHPHLGRCLGGKRKHLDLLWDTDQRQCIKYKTRRIYPDKQEVKQV